MDVGQTISICVPCHNRTHVLKTVFPSWIRAANASPPVEIVIMDYNSPDNLREYIDYEIDTQRLDRNNYISYHKYTGRNYYHMAHARNLSVLAAHGDYIIELHADSLVLPEFIPKVRQVLRPGKWVTVHDSESVMAMYKQDFIDAGGYDERFEFYGPEDKDLNARLVRRGLSCLILPRRYLTGIYTPDNEKVKNYRLPISKREMAKLMTPIYMENIGNHTFVANEGQEWGQWTP